MPLQTQQILIKTCMACLFGMLSATGFAPHLHWLTMWLGCLGLMLLLDENLPCCLWGFFFCYFIVGTPWLANSIHTFGHFSLIKSWGLTLCAMCLMALIPTIIYGVCCKYQCHRLTLPWLGLPLLLVLAEWVRAHCLFSGFPWLLIGLSQWHGPFSTLLPVIGPYGLGWLLLQSMGCVAGLMLHRYPYVQRWLVVMIPITFGACVVFNQSWTTPLGQPIHVAAVQNSRAHYAPKYVDVSTLLARSHHLWPKADLIVWPEGSVAKIIQPKVRWLQQFNTIIQHHHSHLLFGTFTQTHQGVHNTIVGLGGEKPYFDHKHYLVAFGEYFPLPSWLCQWLAKHGVPITQLTPGHQPPALFFLDHHIAVLPIICYELAFPQWVAKQSRQANLLVSVHDMSWFQSSQASMQQLHMAQARSLENGKPQLFVSASGSMAWIDHRGHVRHHIKDNARTTYGIYPLQPRVGQTPYSSRSEWTWLWLAALSFFVLCPLKSKNR